MPLDTCLSLLLCMLDFQHTFEVSIKVVYCEMINLKIRHFYHFKFTLNFKVKITQILKNAAHRVWGA